MYYMEGVLKNKNKLHPTLPSVNILPIGIGLIILGINDFISGSGSIKLNWRMQIEVLNGALPLILGIGFVIGAVMLFFRRNKLSLEDIRRRRKEGKERARGFNHFE